jgi:hypothetical protein
MKVIDALSQYMTDQGYVVMAKFSSIPLLKARQKNPLWKLQSVSNNTHDAQKNPGGNMARKGGFRIATKTYCFKFVGQKKEPQKATPSLHILRKSNIKNVR